MSSYLFIVKYELPEVIRAFLNLEESSGWVSVIRCDGVCGFSLWFRLWLCSTCLQWMVPERQLPGGVRVHRHHPAAVSAQESGWGLPPWLRHRAALFRELGSTFRRCDCGRARFRVPGSCPTCSNVTPPSPWLGWKATRPRSLQSAAPRRCSLWGSVTSPGAGPEPPHAPSWSLSYAMKED